MTEPPDAPVRRRTSDWWAPLATQARRASASGLPHFLLALAAIQGATYLAQFAVARLVSPAEFGIVRTVEATLGIALVVASAGLPSLAIKSIATMPDAASKGRLLRRLLLVVGATSGSCALALMIASPWIVAPGARPWLLRLAGLLVPMAVGRTAINFFQGIRTVQTISIRVGVTSLAGVALISWLVSSSGLNGWIAGRYLAEGAVALVALATCGTYLRQHAELPPSVGVRRLLREGGAVSLSLLVRTGIDNVPVLSLGWFAVRATDVGFFGLGSLAAAALLLVPGALNSLGLAPLVTAYARSAHDARRLLLRLQTYTAMLTIPGAVLIAIAMPLLLRTFAPQFVPGANILRALVLVVPLKGITSTSGGALLAAGRIPLSVRYNVATLATTLLAIAVLVPRYGAGGAVTALVAAESLSAVLFARGSWRVLGEPALDVHVP